MWENTIPPLPNEITSLANPTLRQRAEKAWKAGHTILNAIQVWDNWVNDSRVSYSADKTFSLDNGDEISRDGATAIRFLCSDQGASRPLFASEDSSLLQIWPKPPSEWPDKTYYVDWNPWDSMNPVTQAINGELLQLHNILESEVRKILDDLAFSPMTALKQAEDLTERLVAGREDAEMRSSIASESTSQITRWEKLKKRALNTRIVVFFVSIGIVAIFLVTLISNLKTLIEWTRNLITWLWP